MSGDAARIDRPTFVDRVLGLGLDPATYLVHGSGPLLLLDLVDDVGDIDLVVDDVAWRNLVARPDARVQSARLDRVVELPGRIQAFDGWWGESAEAVLARAERRGSGIPCASLTDVLAFKRRLGRPKDVEHIRRIETVRAAARGEPSGADGATCTECDEPGAP